MKDKITVIVTLYNRLEYARNMILALQQQTKQIDELIFADDGSSEKLMEYIEDLLVDCNFKIKHVYQDDIGFRLARSRNNGAREASGDYLIFLDQDVIFDNDFIESIYNSRRKKRMIFSEALGSSLEEKNKIQELINTQKFDYKEIYDLVDNTKKVEQDQIVNKEKFYNFLYKLKLRSRGAKIVGLIFSLFKEDFININPIHMYHKAAILGESPNEDYYRQRKIEISKKNYRCEYGYDKTFGEDKYKVIEIK